MVAVGDRELAEDTGSLVQAQAFCCPDPGPPGRRQGVDWGCQEPALRGHLPSRKHHLADSFWHAGDMAPAPSGSCEKEGGGWVKTALGAGGNSAGQAGPPPPHLLEPLDVGAAEL